ncbi:MAG: lmo0937 family membrane protein [Polyangiales bacterium]
MLYTLAAILLLAWLLGFGAFHITSGLIHLVLVLAVIVVAIQLFTGRRAV